MEISNKFLTTLLVAAVIVSIIGISLNLNKINEITGNDIYGLVNITITENKAINVTATACNFGSGYVDDNTLYAQLQSNGTAENWSGAGTSSTIEIRNDGNADVFVNLTASKNCTDFMGGDCNLTLSEYKTWAADKDAGACESGLLAFANLANLTTDGLLQICDTLQFEDETDEVYVYCHLQIGNNASLGSKGDVWTFTFG